MQYQYFTFGLHIQSDLELPELLVSELFNPSDVTILVGKTPKRLPNCQKKGVAYEVAKNEFLLDLKDIARFYVKNGDTIIIEPKRKSVAADIRLFLLGSCFGAILHQRKILVMHASAIKHEGAAVLFTGISGVGKSSTANAFRLKGYKMLTDDVCPIQFNKQQPFALPSYPQAKLWEDTLEQLELDYNHLKYIRKGVNKRAVPFLNDFVKEPLPIKTLYILQEHNKETIELIDVSDADKFRLIRKMTYRKYMLKEMGMQSYHFINASQLANYIPVKRIIRPQIFCLPEVVALIQKDLEKLNVVTT